MRSGKLSSLHGELSGHPGTLCASLSKLSPHRGERGPLKAVVSSPHGNLSSRVAKLSVLEMKVSPLLGKVSVVDGKLRSQR